VPIVVLDGCEDLENGLEAIRKARADHLCSSELNGPLLIRAIRYAIERKRAEQTIQEGERRYRELLAAVKTYAYSVELADGVPVSTTHGPGCLTTTGYGPEAYAADPYLWFRMVHPGDRDKLQHYVTRLLAGERVPPLEHRIGHRDGTARWVRDTIVPHYDECGGLRRYGTIDKSRRVSIILRIQQERSRGGVRSPGARFGFRTITRETSGVRDGVKSWRHRPELRLNWF
jgi:sigma-B regulation protein RsbU (phosphoserine phosphatase)